MATEERRRATGCTGKVKYPTQRHAKKSLRWRNRHGGKTDRGLQAYRCEFCDGWHLGHGKFT